MPAGCVCQLHADEDTLMHLPKVTHTLNRSIPFEAVSIVVITDGHQIYAVGRLRKGDVVSTFQRRVTIDLAHCFVPLEIARVVDTVPGSNRKNVDAALRGNGKVPPGAWEAIKAAFEILRPEMFEYIRFVEKHVRAPLAISKDSRYAMALLEKEAVGLSLSLSGIGREVLESWRAPSGPAHFLDGLDVAAMSEDQLIQQDAEVFGDWRVEMRVNVATRQFTDGQRRLTIINVNRRPVEETLGVDLVYYHHQFRAFVLVQYKKFSAETRKEGDRRGKVWVFRPSRDKNLESELQRMRQVQNLLGGPVTDPTGYRLNPGPCYLKFCQPELEFHSSDLAHGMYLSLDHFDLLRSCPSVLGPKGGEVFSSESVQRYLNNTEFIGLVQNGWIGSTGVASDIISEFVRAGITMDRSVIMAAGRGLESQTKRT